MTGLESLVGHVSIEDLIEDNCKRAVSVVKQLLTSYYLRDLGESLWDCRYLFESSDIVLSYVTHFLLSMCRDEYRTLRDVFVVFYGSDSDELFLYDCYRDLYQTRQDWCHDEISERPSVHLIEVMGWEEEFVK